MALQIWLPLNKNGDLKNQGLANVTVTNNGATYNSNGKIGGCYKVNGALLSIPSASYMEMKSGKLFSFACWTKGATSSGWFIACLGWEIQFLTGHINVYPGGSSNNRDSKFNGTTAADLWRHIAFTWDGSNLILYVDGNALNTSTFDASYNISSNINFCYQGERYLNDVRIYDHCLTPQEVKEISKGLVIHYPLNDGNVTNIAYDCSGYCNNGTVSGTLTTNTDTPRYDKCYTFGGNKLISTTASGSHILTMSIWAKDAGSIPSDGLMFKDHLGDMALGIQSNTLYSGKSGGGGAGSVPISNISYTTNTWHHWVMVNRNGTYYVYMDGLQVLSGTSGSWGAGSVNALHIGGRSGSSPWPGKLSDFRAYCTALSEDDVKALYQEAAFIDHKGNIGCYLFYEDADSQITKTGQVKTEEFEEISDLTDGVAKVYELKIECNQLIEI